MTINIVVPGRPVPKQRPRVTRYGTYTPKATLNYEAKIRELCPNQHFEKGIPLQMIVTAYMPIPKSWTEGKKDLARQGVIYPTCRPDIDNLSKTAMDALNKIAFYDDSQIVQLITTQYYSDEPRLAITIQSMSEADTVAQLTKLLP